VQLQAAMQIDFALDNHQPNHGDDTTTISVLMEQLNNLSNATTEANHDINTFNTNVRRLLTSYYANKQEAYNETALFHNLARA
jgi:hypothetical protein